MGRKGKRHRDGWWWESLTGYQERQPGVASVACWPPEWCSKRRAHGDCVTVKSGTEERDVEHSNI